MGIFHFRLDRILRLRHQGENQSARQLGEALRNEAEAGRRLEDASQHLDRCQDHMTDVHTKAGTTPAGLIRQLRVATQNAADGVHKAAQAHGTSQEAVDRRKEEFTEARRERRILERLRERTGEEWNRERAQAEQKETDAIAQLRWRPKEETP